MEEAIEQVIIQFPGREAHIKQLWARDEDFRDLCQDYMLCLKKLAYWSAAEGKPQIPIREYLSLRQKLEIEIEIKIRKVQLCVGEPQLEETNDEQ